MEFQVAGKGAFQRLLVRLSPHETCSSEAGAMVRMSPNVLSDVTARSKGQGGLLGGLKRLVAGDSFFVATYRAAGKDGEVVLAPRMLGEIAVIALDGASGWLASGGSYLAHGGEVEIGTRYQGLRGLFTSENLFFVEASGRGPLAVGAFGALSWVDVQGEYVVDTGHVVAFEQTLEYKVTKAGSSWIQSFLAGEGFVMRFHGHGRLLVQSHNERAFGKEIGPKLPPR